MSRRRLTGSAPGKRIAIALMAGLGLLALLVSGVAASSSLSSDGATSSSSRTLTASASVSVSATITPVRVIVVDEAGVIREIWSNTPGIEHTLRVRLGSRSGPDLPSTDEVLAQYASLVSTLDWDAPGLVYSS